MIIRLVALVALAAAMVPADSLAQGTFPAPLPGQGAAPIERSAPMASLGGPATVPLVGVPMQGTPTSETQAACLKGYNLLREDAEKKGKLIKGASDRHASAVEACKIIASYGAAEVKMIKYMEANAAQCGISPQVGDQLKKGHKDTEALEKKVCAVAERMKTRGAEPVLPVGTEEVLDPEHGQPRGVISDFGDPAYKRMRRELPR